MSDPALAIQTAVEAALRASTDLKAAMGGTVRLYDRVSEGAPFPYITIGEDQILSDEADGYDGSEAFVTLHAWSRAVGKAEIKAMVGAVRKALNVALDLGAEHRCTEHEYQGARYLRDPDGLTEHAVITLRYLTEPGL